MRKVLDFLGMASAAGLPGSGLVAHGNATCRVSRTPDMAAQVHPLRQLT